VTHHTPYLRVPVVTELRPLIFSLLAADYHLHGDEDIICMTRLAKNLSLAISTQLSTTQHCPRKDIKLRGDLLVEFAQDPLIHDQAVHIVVETTGDVGHLCAFAVHRDERTLALQIRCFVHSHASSVVGGRGLGRGLGGMVPVRSMMRTSISMMAGARGGTARTFMSLD
jgi:hypothetical protein